MPERRYNEQELAAILRAAAEAQAQGSRASEPEGFSLADIERLAQEVGIDPALIAPAAGKLQATSRPKRFRLFATPIRETYEYNADEILDDSAWEDVVAELRVTFASSGKVSTVGFSREWVGGTDFLSAHLSATPRKGRTRYLLSVRRDGAVFVTGLLTFLIALFGSAALGTTASVHGGHPLAIFGAVLAFTGGVIFTANRMLSGWYRRTLNLVDDTMRRVQEIKPEQNLETGPTSAELEELPKRLHQGN